MEAGKETVTRNLLLKGLDCTNCAAKIERGVGKIQGVASCGVNFMTQTLTVQAEQVRADAVMAEVRQTVNRLEPHIRVQEKGRPPAAGLTRSYAPGPRDNKRSEDRRGHSAHGHGGPFHEHEHEHGHEDGHDRKHEHGLEYKYAHEHDSEHAHRNEHKHEHDNHEHAGESVSAKELRSAHSSVPHVQDSQANGQEHGEEHDHSHDHSGHTHDHGSGAMRKLLMRLGAGAVICGIALAAPLGPWAELALFLAAYLIIGGDIVLQALRNIGRGQVFDEYFLMTVATVGAFAIQEYPEGVAVMFFYQVGELFQSMAVNRSRRSISSLMDIRPDYANLQDGTGSRRVSPEEVRVGDRIIVRPGEKIPLDGKVVEGRSAVDTSALTGESAPRDVEPGSDVLSGFMNQNGVLTVEVGKAFEESTVSKILELVEHASSKKAPTEKFVTKFARFYTPVVVIVALLLAVVPPLAVSGATFSEWVYRALVFLVISCPCALVISIPLGFFGGIGAASRSGILVKGSNYLEALNDVKIVVFDKTGTLTKGTFAVTGVYPDPEGSLSQEELLRYAAYAELHSGHPIAESIRKAYGKPIPEEQLQDYNEISGHGIQVNIEGKDVLAGNGRLMEREGISFAPPEQAGTLVHVAVAGRYAGYLVISDEVKDDADEAIRLLKQLGIKKTVMLTGDTGAVAESVRQRLGIDEAHAELLPQHKVEQLERLERLKTGKEKMIFVGDGINDTPVLARADVGVAMGGLGSDAAIEAADIVIMTDEPSKIPAAISIAKRTRRIVWQNIGFALGVKALFLLLGAMGIATMWEAVFSDVGVTLLAVLNAMRVLRLRPMP
ncbi:Cd2+/Zn2+-exporting ATPase [Paenibacillus sp. UNCCL117]|uniref:heavy metal translocating P-type ATPase n=1 Tax=unclassified Paenibacillus TaxID=185978 RepID=UPI000887A1C9|nr:MULTISPECIES: heavy metal translocating P-type ATPase [unclassified Paenibacillus]SDE01895.1 Cd2+/Zn2+-exporting ATPase [Paenibacillus sp. cl123]SFW57098.1 Cd2+/Zn2+-exporting ATPase [Paenibacillus sp. UNCCL117]